SLEDAIAYVAALEEARASLEEDESGEREIVSEITLLSDVENVEIVGGAYITIDLNGKEILGTVSVDEDSSLKVSGSGTIDAALDIRGDVTLSGDNDGVKVYPDEALGIAEGGVLTVEGNVEIILDIGDNLDIGYYFEEEDGELIYESGLIIEGDLIITVTGDNEILAGDGTFISEEGSLKIVVESGAALTIDTCGTEVDACVTLEGRSSLEVVDSSSSGEGKLDGTVTVFEGADVSLYDGTYKDYPDGLTITFVDADGNEIEDGSMLMESAMAEDGERYIHSTTEKEHKAGGHSYDLENYCVELAGEMATFYELDAETSEIVMYFKCYCGEELTVRIHITEDDYFSEAAKNAEGERIVRVLYNNLSVTVTSSNGISASYLLHGETVLEMFIEAGDDVRLGDKEYDDYDGREYRYYYIYEPAGCDHTGEDIYIYGSYSGVVIRETVGITHTGLCVYEERGEHTIYYCSDCEYYFIDNTSVSASDAYDYSEVEKELEREQSFNETKESLMESLDMAITGCAEESGSIWGIYSGALDELDGREYEFTGGEDRDAYLEALTAEIEDIVANALFEIAEENQRGQTKNALESFFEELLSEDNQSFLDEYYSKEAQDELNEIYAAVMGDVESADFGFSVYDEDAGSSYADYTEYLEGKYSEYIENVIARVNAVNVIKVDADEDESDSDVIYSFISNDNGISGVIKLVIEKSDDKKLDKKIKNAELVSGDGKIEDDKLAEYIEDKSVVGVYDFSLWDTSSNARVYVFSGVYYVCLQLPEELKGRDDLVIVYLGDDGVLEVYSTSVSEDGESLYFSTTHFSEYIILGDSQRDLTAIIIVLAVVGGVALIALIILLVIFILRKRDENGGLVKETKTAALAPAALLLVTVVPSGAIGIIIALSVVDAALIAGAIVMAWLVST
ncbi:MAG: hypothetical protein LUD29_06545, partial [Clostridia bacterium]|nr:hypothetical protein [Clostridia bacterium]